jgi:uncharacterized membrane protein
MEAMEHLAALIRMQPWIALHLTAALLAIPVGAFVLARRKGTSNHKRLGWLWVALMATATLSSVFIRGGGMPNLNGWSPIHLLTLTVALMLPLGIALIRRGDVSAHRKVMRNLFIGACVVAGAFTLLPGRRLGDLLWKHGLGLVA